MFWHQGAIVREFLDSNIECKKMHGMNTIKFTLQHLHLCHPLGRRLEGLQGLSGHEDKKKRCFSQLCEDVSNASPFWKMKSSDLDCSQYLKD